MAQSAVEVESFGVIPKAELKSQIIIATFQVNYLCTLNNVRAITFILHLFFHTIYSETTEKLWNQDYIAVNQVRNYESTEKLVSTYMKPVMDNLNNAVYIKN